MDQEQLIASSATPYPGAGTLRVHPHPEALPRPEPERPGLNRFDDPRGLVAIRYTATRLVGCLRETLARFRPDLEAESLLAAIVGVDPDDLEPDAHDSRGVGDWLSVQRVGTVRALKAGSFIDVEACWASDTDRDLRPTNPAGQSGEPSTSTSTAAARSGRSSTPRRGPIRRRRVRDRTAQRLVGHRPHATAHGHAGANISCGYVSNPRGSSVSARPVTDRRHAAQRTPRPAARVDRCHSARRNAADPNDADAGRAHDAARPLLG